MARRVISQLLKFGEVRRAPLGISVQDLTPGLASTLDLDASEGAVVAQVEQDSAAGRAGIRAGDVVIAFNERPVRGGDRSS